MDKTTKQAVDFLINYRKELEEMIYCMQITIDSLKTKKPMISVDSFSETDVNLSISTKVGEASRGGRPVLAPEEGYNPHGKLDQKISYALTKIGNGFREDIIAEIAAAQPDLDPYKLEKAIAVRLCYLLKYHFINGKKIGRRFEYSFIKEN